MKISNCIPTLYIMTLSLLIAHEIDSTYWHEWELFGIPGGIQFFVLLHIPLVMVALWGFQKIVGKEIIGIPGFPYSGYCGNERFPYTWSLYIERKSAIQVTGCDWYPAGMISNFSPSGLSLLARMVSEENS